MSEQRLERERRSWPRLPLAIPVFVRSRDDDGTEFLEFATALNISACGVLVAVRRSLPLSARLSLEIPTESDFCQSEKVFPRSSLGRGLESVPHWKDERFGKIIVTYCSR